MSRANLSFWSERSEAIESFYVSVVLTTNLNNTIIRRTPLNLLGDYLGEAQAAQTRGNNSAAHDAVIRGLVKIAEIVDPVNRNRLGLKALQNMLGDALKIEEETQLK